MGKRYFCDYCDRTFLDDPDSRLKHLQGISHIRNKNLHYKKFKDLKTIYAEEKAKEVCRRYQNTGQCQFNENCNYTHYSEEDLSMIQKQIEEEERKKNSYKHITDASIDEWLNKRKNKNTALRPMTSNFKEVAEIHQSSEVGLRLPISLQPVKDEQLCELKFIEWG